MRFHEARIRQEDPRPRGRQAVTPVEISGQGSQHSLPGIGIRRLWKADEKAPIQRTILEDRPDHSATLVAGVLSCESVLRATMQVTTSKSA